MMNDDANKRLWREPPDRGGKRSGVDPVIVKKIRWLHEKGRTVEEISLGLDLDKEEIEIALAGGIMPRKAEERRR